MSYTSAFKKVLDKGTDAIHKATEKANAEMVNEIEKHQTNYELLDTILKAGGINTTNFNAQQLVQKVSSELTRVQKHDAIVKELGYSSFDNLAKSVKMRKAPITSPVEIFAEKYNLDISFLLHDIGECWDTQAEGKDEIKRFANLKKKIIDYREMVTEAYIYFMEEVEQQATEAGFSEEKIKAEVIEWHETMRENFHKLNASEFWQMYKGRIAGVQLIEPEPTPPPKPAEIPLSEYKEHCENHYPALFLDQVFADPEKLGTVTRERADNWDASAANYRDYKDEKAKKESQSNFARKILTIAISRLANDPEFAPTVNHENKLNHLLKPLEDPTMEEPLQLEYILNEFINHPELV